MLAAFVVAFALLGVAAGYTAGPLPGDPAVTRSLQKLSDDGMVGLILLYAGGAAWSLPAVVLAVAIVSRRWAGALCILLSGVAAVLAGDVLKALVGRPRPSADLTTRYGFPSSTAMLTVVVLGVACYLLSSCATTGPRAVSRSSWSGYRRRRA